MKITTLLLAGAVGLALAGCTTTGQQVATQITTTTQTVQQKAKEAQAYAANICGYLPALASVIAIFNSGYSQNVAVVGDAICSAVTNLPLADGPGKREPRVNGVLVRGRWAR